ncbi:MAG: hypothetical protein IKU40_09660 [Clostridia bacterium]|nr:hypothetical protein [Clostridia bacterium]
MKSVYSGYARIETDGAAYFAGANTADGFRGIYDEIADETVLERVYVIKGGAGTGKSTLIRKVAEAAAKAGWTAELYFCGSDPYSLDCAVLDGRIAVLDGTAPHVRELTYPGAASSLIDVTRFWDAAVLETCRDDILAHCHAKSDGWASAYRYLRAAAAVNEERSALSGTVFDRAKAEAYFARRKKEIGKPKPEESGRTVLRYTRAVTMRGRYYLPTFERLAETVYAVSDAFGCAALFLDRLAGVLAAAGYDTVVSRLPVTGHTDGIFLPAHRIAFVTAETDADARRLNMSRFVTEEIPEGFRGQMRLAAKIGESCMEEAESALARAAEAHFALEEIYRSAMDFPALGRYTKKICAEITERLKK